MTRFFGEVGYGESTEEPSGSGVWIDNITEVQYYGEVVRNKRRLDDVEKLNEDISVGNDISIVADDFANQNFLKIKYIRWAGVLWTVTNVEVKNPRLILSLGKVYNGPSI